jgi:hypothetical protein
MISVFGDESHDSKNERVFAIGCLLGTDDQWAALRVKWSERTLSKTFHAADCESSQGAYRGIKPEDNHRLHRDLTRILAGSGIIGWGVAIDVAATRRIFPHTLPDQNFTSSFVRTIWYMTLQAAMFVPQEQIRFIFDRHPHSQHNMGRLYKLMLADDDWVNRPDLAEELTFSPRSEIGIQAADLWARELMKRLDGELFSSRYVSRIQWQVLTDTKRFGGHLQMAGYFEGMSKNMEAIQEREGVRSSEYVAWLNRKGLDHNQTNCIRYTEHVSLQKLKSRREQIVERG